MHFNLNKRLTQSDVEEENCMAIENISSFNLELNSDCNFQHSINENEMNFQRVLIMNCCIPVFQTQK